MTPSGLAFRRGPCLGAPKIRAMEIIAELEGEKRGPYGGAVGYFSYSGDMDTALVLRTGVYKDGVIYVQAGGGIVADSTGEDEYHGDPPQSWRIDAGDRL